MRKIKDCLRKSFEKVVSRGVLCAFSLIGFYYGTTKAIVDHPLSKLKIEMKQEESISPCEGEMELKYSWEQIEDIVNSINTPEEAFEKIAKNIKFPKETLNGCSLARWTSFQETYSLGSGNCMEGAAAFAAILSDNPEYDVKLVHIDYGETGHMISLFYEEKGAWGITSFNDHRGENDSVFYPAEYSSLEEAVAAYCATLYQGKCKRYAQVTLTPEELKFDRDLYKKSAYSEWLSIPDKNE